jgi:hypothetical protein
MSSVKQMDRKPFVFFISVPHKFFRPQPVHRSTQLAQTPTPSEPSGHQMPQGITMVKNQIAHCEMGFYTYQGISEPL